MNSIKDRTKKHASYNGARAYQNYWDRQMANPEFLRLYAEEAKKKALWLRLVEARELVGLTQAEVAKRMGVSQAQIARIEKRGYDAYTLNTIRRYLAALGDQFSLEIVIERKGRPLTQI